MNASDPVDFWEELDKLATDHQVVIDRPNGTHHPHYEDVIYPLDYGYLEGTTAADGAGIDIWRGEKDGPHEVTALILTVDLLKNDAEIKIALNCGEDDLQTILSFHKRNKMGAILVRKPLKGK